MPTAAVGMALESAFKLGVVQMSIIGNNHRIIRHIEPGAPSYRRRLAALKKLAEAGIWTTVRVNPLFPKHPDGYFTDEQSIISRFGSKAAAPVLDLYDDNFIPELAEAKVPSLLAGFVRLSGRSINSMSKASGVDIKPFFKPEYLATRGDRRYSDREIFAYYKKFQNDCSRNNVRFTTCYIGNGIKDYFQYQGLWDNKKDCCDVLGNVKSFKTTSQTIDWETRTKQAPCKTDAEKARAMDEAATKEFGETGRVSVPAPTPKGESLH